MKEITELLKGVLEGCVLEIIGQGETYGYEITQKLRKLGFEDVVEGTVYTITMRLEKRDWLEVTNKPAPIGPPRKWYRLNEAGQTERQNFWEKWMFISEKLEILRDKTKFTTEQGENDD